MGDIEKINGKKTSKLAWGYLGSIIVVAIGICFMVIFQSNSFWFVFGGYLLSAGMISGAIITALAIIKWVFEKVVKRGKSDK